MSWYTGKTSKKMNKLTYLCSKISRLEFFGFFLTRQKFLVYLFNKFSRFVEKQGR